MKIKTGSGTISLLSLSAIYSISLITSLPGLAISPILGDLEKVFKGTSQMDIQQIESLPSLIIVPFILLSGSLSIFKNQKRLLLIGLVLFFGSSICYFFAGTMSYLLINSIMLGVGAGMVIPLAKGMLADRFAGEKRTAQLGIASAISNLALVVATFGAGFLASINWRYSFAVYCISGLTLLLSFFIDNSDVKQKAAVESVDKAVIGSRWPWPLMLFYFFITYVVVTVSFNLSLFLQAKNIGGGDLSGTLLPIFFLAIMLSGFLLGKLIRRFRKSLVQYSLILMTVGLLSFLVVKQPWMIGVSCFVTGAGYGVLQPLIYDKTASWGTSDKATFNLSLVLAMNYVAILLYPYILGAFKDILGISSPYFPFALNGALCLAFTVYAYFRRHSKTFSVTA